MKGFTLLETIVTIGIIGTVSGLLLLGWPRTRHQQALLLANEQLQALFRTAQQKALNEERSAACLSLVGSAPADQRRCSDIGVALRGGQIVLFADIGGDDAHYDEQDDLALETHTLALGVSTADSAWQSFLFRATPPTIELFADDFVITLHSGDTERRLDVKNYGHIEK